MRPQTQRYDVIGVSCLLVTLLGWASILLFLKHLAPYLDAWTTNGWRYGIAALLWLPWLLAQATRGALPEGIWRRALFPAAFNGLGQVLYAWMPYYIGPALGGFLIRFALVSSTLGAFVLFADERRLMHKPAFWAGLAAVIVGSLATVFGAAGAMGGQTATGILMGAASGLLFGMYGVAVRYSMRGVSSMTAFSVISLYTAIGLVALMVLLGRERGAAVVALSGPNWLVLVVSAIVGIAICHVSYYAAIARLGVAVSTAVVQLSPFLCALGSRILFNERLTGFQWMGGIVMIGGALVLLRVEQKQNSVSGPTEGGIVATPLETGDSRTGSGETGRLDGV